MTTDEQYVPDEGQVRAWCREGTGDYPDVMDEWITRFLARVRRDAAREALDGLAEWADLRVREAITDRGADDWRRTRFAVVAHRDTHYPEETP